ncbi:hypothetical protein METBIDRAFT_46931 [Metschnikowia bicuspidata var. bicuspidata NRRL YB-4993]|uniref:Uncharacterized protein n=1 Tax=Metschnikowia bicuspidata var. bicuspidata NRRL YB-4993 TaxID=869754 RepID=A0A1A0H573_9ASCO|nr:hypothetical protein METBIDRAFT_46931 [Metschnikowia bicuspidata var. bicuspidata NRRL YB-4993]OBA19229.1 hypothetical protein METBIDRAFT_46931 [Metschnikowia bicuspidata var. bicuspidata NRRL YB-4993]
MIQANRTSWFRNLLILASSLGACVGLYLAGQIYLVHALEKADVVSRQVFIPLWMGVNWPWQRRFALPQYLRYFDPAHPAAHADRHGLAEIVQRDDVEHQVLDCLFRLTVVRETFKLPISVRSTPTDTFELWIEPRHCTLHGPRFRIGKTDNAVSVSCDWHIKLVKWASNIDEFVSGLTSELGTLSTAEAQRNTHDKGSGRVHRANTAEDASSRPLEALLLRDQLYNFVFKGTLNVSDLSELRTGVVAFTGVIDNTHIGLSGGVKIVAMTLDVIEDGKPSILYKIK